MSLVSILSIGGPALGFAGIAFGFWERSKRHRVESERNGLRESLEKANSEIAKAEAEMGDAIWRRQKVTRDLESFIERCENDRASTLSRGDVGDKLRSMLSTPGPHYSGSTKDVPR